ncbi:hypothetical protein AOL_s00176g54 [Orbilia oligospora ATCC 24927]|uniref:Uncharacterized protein n=1 Tax=Arthrobotrys oligospora (strain ATCC 24927 / CBS 115.81 / DSM 1491) TaxID=756982 RepID=G1XPT0_ARTOA|nr:hypothetical protein AOL_s00176g54 [Orbilia oligospora ATCC 24927]EGX44883.1 hypothetical protein AOL_s00176g54 [Orbilia oligospora ATCC 24927]
MRKPRIFQTPCLITTWLLTLTIPCHAFYRLWGYSDLRRNLENTRLFKAQSSLLTRGSKQNQKPLCHSFPDPSDTPLGVIRVVGIMNHPDLANPIQAMGLWEEKDFNCGPFLPRLVIYFQPGQETQIIDLRPFGGEWVYSNWKQIVPGDQYWNSFIAPELTTGKERPGSGFVKKIKRKEDDHNFAEGASTVWNTQVPEDSWIIDKRPALLQRDASKSGFESRFKTELTTLLVQEIAYPLSDKKALELAVGLTIMKQALAEQCGKWRLNRIDRDVQGLPEEKNVDSQFMKMIKTDTPIVLNPFLIGYQGLARQQDLEQIGQQGQVEQQMQIEGGTTEAPIEVKEEAEVKREEVKKEEDQTNPELINPGLIPPIPALSKTPRNQQISTNPNNPGYRDLNLAMQTYMNTFPTPQQANFPESLIQNYNPYANGRIPDPITYTTQPWAPSIEEMILMHQQSLLHNEYQREQKALERTISGTGFLPIKPRPLGMDPSVKVIPQLHRFITPIPRLVANQGVNVQNINAKRVLPSAEDTLKSIEGEQLRKGFVPNQSPQQPTWAQVQEKREEEGEEEEEKEELPRIPKPRRPQSEEDFIRDFLERNTKADKRKTRDI